MQRAKHIIKNAGAFRARASVLLMILCDFYILVLFLNVRCAVVIPPPPPKLKCGRQS